jgi:hypothetical protein
MSDWAFMELLGSDLGDVRRTERLTAMVSAFAAHPECSPWCALEDAHQAKAAYRFWDNGRCTVESILSGHVQRTRVRCQAHREVLVAQDSTEFNYTSHRGCAGLGYTSRPHTQGVKAHAALAIAPDGDPLGVLDLFFWTRDNELLGRRKHRNRRPTEEKETARWLRGLQAAAGVVPAEGRAVVLGDAESDFFDLFAAPRAPGVELLVRVLHRRRRVEHPQQYVLETVLTRPLGCVTLEIPAISGRAARQARLNVYATSAVVPPPANHPRPACGPIRLSWVLAQEAEPPPGAAAVEWLLATTLSVDTLAEAAACLDRYRLRWRIERFFYALKQGCAVEKLELKTVERLERAVATYAIVAWRLLHLLYHAQTHPEQPCSPHFEPLEIDVLRRGAPARLAAPPGPLTNGHALRLLGKLGGHPSRARDGPPGVKSLWRGLRRLHDQAYGYAIAIHDLLLVGRA